MRFVNTAVDRFGRANRAGHPVRDARSSKYRRARVTSLPRRPGCQLARSSSCLPASGARQRKMNFGIAAPEERPDGQRSDRASIEPAEASLS